MADYRLSATLSVNDGMTAKLRSAQKAAESLTRGVGSLKNQDLKWRVGVEGLEKIKRLQSMARGMKFSPIRITAQDNATPKLSQLKSQLNSIAGKAHNVIVNVKTTGMEGLRGLKSNLGELGNGMMMATGAGMLGLAGVGYGLTDTIKTYKDFDYQMRRNQALFTAGMNPEESERIYQQLTETARKYGSTMIFTNAEVGKALEYMALAGWDANTSMAALPAVLNAAVSSGEDLSLVSDIITDDMTAMGYKAGTYVKNGMGEMVEATQHFSDVLLRTTLRSNTNFQQLGYAMKYAAPLAHSLGYSIEDVAIAMGLMANNGIKADQAGTALRGLLVRMAKAPKQAAEAMQALGVDAFDAATGKAKGLMQNLMQIRAALKGKDADKMLDFVEAMTGEEIGQRGEVADFIKDEMAANGGKLTDKSLAKLASQFSGTYALAGFLAMMNSTDEDIQKLMSEIYQKSDGTGKEINAKMMDTLQGDLKTIQSAWEDFQTELMSGKGSDGLRSFLQAATKDINAFKTALKDGFDLSDIFGLVGNVVTQLKDKFLALDGIGSILAGGVLMVGLKKLLNMGLKVKTALGEVMKLGAAGALTGSKAGTITPATATSSVGTMNVRAGVVNLSGAIKGLQNAGLAGKGTAPPVVTPAQSRYASQLQAAQTSAQAANLKHQYAQAASVAAWHKAAQSVNPKDIAAAQAASLRATQAHTEATAATKRLTAIQNSQVVAQKYYADRAQILSPQPAPAPTPTVNVANEARAMRMANMKSAAGGGAALAAVFGAMDYFSTKSMNKLRVDEVDKEISEQKRILQDIRGLAETSPEQIQNQMAAIQQLETTRNDLIRQNAADERLAMSGAAGSVAGTALGAAIGSLVGPIGTMIGGMIGGMIGDKLGRSAGEMGNEREFARQPYTKPEVNTAPIREIFAKQTGTEQLISGKYEFENPLVREPIDRTGLAHKGNFFDAGQPLPPPTPPQTDYDALKVLGRGHGYQSAAEKTAAYEAETQRLEGDLQKQIRGGYERQAQAGTGLWNQGAAFDAYSEGAKALQEFKNLTPYMQARQTPEIPFASWLKNFSPPQIPTRSDQTIQHPKFETQPPIKIPEIKMPEFSFASIFDDLFGVKRAAAAELNETQLLQQAQMERGIQPSAAPTAPTEIQKPEVPDLGLDGLTENLFSQLQGLGEGAGEIFSNLGTTIQEGLTSSLEGVGETFSQLGTTINEGLTSSLEGVGETFSQLGTTIQEGLTSSLEGANETLATFGTTIQEGLATALTGVGETFSQLGTTIQSGLESARAAAESSMSAIKASFDSGISAIQAAWGALPGFFSGIFSGLGGAASAAGATIAAGLTACIGAVIGAWQSAAATISSIISSISSAASSIGGMLPSIGGHYMGTASFEGGFTEVNEHGGELMILPRGTKIYPHATTKEILHREIQNRFREQEKADGFGIGDLNLPVPNQFNNLEGLQPANISLPVPRYNLPETPNGSNSTSTTTNNSSSNATINFGGVNITNGMDFDEFVHRLRAAISNSAANSAQF